MLIFVFYFQICERSVAFYDKEREYIKMKIQFIYLYIFLFEKNPTTFEKMIILLTNLIHCHLLKEFLISLVKQKISILFLLYLCAKYI